jgi:HAD superfamily hydrolase (TIGR01549 family)
MIKAVILDHDGVIADSFSMACKIINEILSRKGMKTYTEDDYRDRFFARNANEFFRMMGFKGREFDEVRDYFEEQMKKKVKMFEGAVKLLENLKEKYKLAMATNAPRPYIETVLGKSKNLFDFIVTGSEAKPKPDPEQILICLEKLSVKPEESVFICDTRHDIAAARAAKIGKIIGVSYGFHLEKNLKDADIIVHSPMEILNFLDMQ